MKRILTLLLACCLLLSCVGCSGLIEEEELYEADFPGPLILWDRPAPTPRPTPSPTPVPTPTPTPAPVYENPLNGAILSAPYTGRVFAASISNVEKAIPHNGLNNADIVFESYVNGTVVRLLAVYSDIGDVEAFGGVRSTRPMWHDIVQHYDAFLIHSGGHPAVLSQLKNLPVDHYNIDSWALREAKVSYRAKVNGRPYENCLMGGGANLIKYASNNGQRVTQPEGKDYGLQFVNDNAADGGSPAATVSVQFKFGTSSKLTEMKYDAKLDKYVFWQYGRAMWDLRTGDKEAFQNVVVMNTKVTAPSGYHHADFTAGGDGYFASGGMVVPILWTCEGQDKPLRFTHQDGSPLSFERGNTYIAVAPVGSVITIS